MNLQLRVVLIRPEVAGNVGATARVTRNFGHSELILVAPKADPLSTEARQRAVQAEPLLESARIVASLDEALSGCVATAGTSARTAGPWREADGPEAVIARLLSASADGPIALVFGPEPSGLTNAEVSRCDHLITIPTDDGYPALNLSHAVAICLYEVRRQLHVANVPVAKEPPASDEEREQAYQHVRAALEDIHFLWDEKADLLFHGLRRLLNRANPTANELRILHGIARQMQWVVRTGYKTGDAPAD